MVATERVEGEEVGVPTNGLVGRGSLDQAGVADNNHVPMGSGRLGKVEVFTNMSLILNS